MELVSVIVPVYNVEQYLEKCIDSIINQTYKNLEIILIDDGSTDSSGKICDRYAARDKRIKVIHQENGGLAVVRNIGVSAASGEYIMFVDSDDYIDTEIVQFLYEQSKKYCADISICGFKYADKNGKVWDGEPVTIDEGIVSKRDFWEHFYSDTRIFYVTLWAKLFRRSVWKNISLPAGKLHEDEFAVYHLIENADAIAVSKKPMYYYVQSDSSIIRTKFTVKNLDAAEAMLLRCGFFTGKKEFDLAEKSLTMAMYNITRGLELLKEPSGSDKERIHVLQKDFRMRYRKLLFKNINLLSKIKCGIFAISGKLFMKLKRR